MKIIVHETRARVVEVEVDADLERQLRNPKNRNHDAAIAEVMNRVVKGPNALCTEYRVCVTALDEQDEHIFSLDGE